MSANLASLSLQDPGHVPAEYSHAVDDKTSSSEKEVVPAFDRQVSHDRIARGLEFHGVHGASIEEYHYWARVQREEEEEDYRNGIRGTNPGADFMRSVVRKTVKPRRAAAALDEPPNEKDLGKPEVLDVTDLTGSSPQYEGLPPDVTHELDIHRALRLTSISSVFALIVTDIFGPISSPYAVSTVGLVPGTILYVVMGVLAALCGWLLQVCFCALDSSRFPVRSYSDLCERLIGSWFRHFVNVLQAVQLIFMIAVIILGNGQSLSQLIRGNALCFTVGVLIWALVGMVTNQVRTLRGFSLVSNVAVILNLMIVFVTMGVIKNEGIDWSVMHANGISSDSNSHPVSVVAFVSSALPDKINGVNNMVFAYAGAMIFVEMMSEMRRPRDFWKGCFMAQTLILVVYLFYSIYFYCYSGEYTMPLSYQGMAAGRARDMCNVVNIITSVIATAIYAAVGIKGSYIGIVEELFHGPRLTTRVGWWLWIPWSILYWALSYVVASAIPQIQTVAGIISAIAIVQFSYSFPFTLALAWWMHRDAMAADGEYTPYAGAQRVDSWRNLSRWRRAFCSGRCTFLGRSIPSVLPKAALLVLALASYAMSGLGMYGSGEAIKMTFDAGGATGTSFGCDSPV